MALQHFGRTMKARTLMIVISVFVIGAGGNFAHDAYQEHERQKMREALSSRVNCSSCAVHKADLKRLREYNAQRSLLEEPADPTVK